MRSVDPSYRQQLAICWQIKNLNGISPYLSATRAKLSGNPTLSIRIKGRDQSTSSSINIFVGSGYYLVTSIDPLALI